jgi:hypothetical protein
MKRSDGKKHCNRKLWRALEQLKQQTRPVELQIQGQPSLQITPAEAHRRLSSNGYSFELRGGLVRSLRVIAPKWVTEKLIWRCCSASVLQPGENYAR